MEPESSGEIVYLYSGCWEAGPDPKAASRDPHPAAPGPRRLAVDPVFKYIPQRSFRSFSGLSAKHFP